MIEGSSTHQSDCYDGDFVCHADGGAAARVKILAALYPYRCVYHVNRSLYLGGGINQTPRPRILAKEGIPGGAQSLLDNGWRNVEFSSR